LDPTLYGKVRSPIKWNEHDRRSTMRTFGRRTSIAARAREQEVVEKAARPWGTRNLESTWRALSSPFNAIPKRSTSPTPRSHHSRTGSRAPMKDRSVSIFSDVTLPSDFDPTDVTDLTFEEESALNTRRKQAILIFIFEKFQAHCRLHLKRKRLHTRIHALRNSSSMDEHSVVKRNALAVAIIRCWCCTYMMRRRFVRLRKAIVILQARRRELVVRLAYQMLIQQVVKVQAMSRSFLVRYMFRASANERLNTYKKQIFALWNKSFTPLSFRTTFWTLLKSASFVRLTIAEQELERLWKDLKIQPVNNDDSRKNASHSGIQFGSARGRSYTIHQKSLKVRQRCFSSNTCQFISSCF
jgi:hypothetical protein